MNFLTTVMFIVFVAASAFPQPDVAAELRARDQALLDAIAVGNVKLWDDVLAVDATYVDESGDILKRADFLK